MSTTDHAAKYQCPGERTFISESVHLARLAAFYPACRQCEHRHETGQLPLTTIEELNAAEHRVQRSSLLTSEGVRGVYLNEITRETAAGYASALGRLLWNSMPLVARTTSDINPRDVSGRTGPVVVVGHDERPSSPDISVGVVRALRTMSCRVIDIGQSTRPCFWYAVSHMQAAAGIQVSGSGCNPVWTGLDFVQSGAVPVSSGRLLASLEEMSASIQPRPSRQAGQVRSFHASLAYEAGLWKHFHALRPVKIVAGSSSQLTTALLQRLFDNLPCRLFVQQLPERKRDLHSPDDPDVVRLSREIGENRADLGILIDDDAQSCAVFDEQGQLIAPRNVTRALMRFLRNENPRDAVLVDSATMQAFPQAADGGTTLEAMSRTFTDCAAVFAGGDSGRYWFREAYPACDAILTLAHVLQLLSLSDAEFSRVIANVS